MRACVRVQCVYGIEDLCVQDKANDDVLNSGRVGSIDKLEPGGGGDASCIFCGPRPHCMDAREPRSDVSFTTSKTHTHLAQ